MEGYFCAFVVFRALYGRLLMGRKPKTHFVTLNQWFKNERLENAHCLFLLEMWKTHNFLLFVI